MKKAVLILQFRHETNAFCPQKADMQQYKNCVFYIGEDVFPHFRGLGTELGAFIDVFEKRSDVELIPSVAMTASPCGFVTDEVYRFAVDEVKKVIARHPHIDGVLINFHGAMVPEGRQDGEGDFLEILRELLGDAVPIISTLDLHANVTQKMARYATALIPYETYPHIDAYETGQFAATLMEQLLDGKVTPTMACRKIPYLLPLLASESPAMKPLYHAAKEWQRTEDVLSVRFTHGFFASDIAEMGMAAIVIADNDTALAERVADALAAEITTAIPTLTRQYPSLDEALDIAEKAHGAPVVIADASDNPGAGGLSDTTHILRRILERQIRGAAIATIVDPASVQACVKSGVGTTIALQLGGWSDKEYSGGPIAVNAYVKMITDGKYVFKGKMSRGSTINHGTTAVIEVEGNTVLVTSIPRQPLDLEVFRSHGIAPEEQRLLVTKSAVHYQASYGTVAGEMIAVALPGYASPTPENFRYTY